MCAVPVTVEPELTRVAPISVLTPGFAVDVATSPKFPERVAGLALVLPLLPQPATKKLIVITEMLQKTDATRNNLLLCILMTPNSLDGDPWSRLSHSLQEVNRNFALGVSVEPHSLRRVARQG